MRTTLRNAALLGCLLTLASSSACRSASTSGTPFGSVPQNSEFETGSPDQIERAEIERRGATDQTAMELIRRLRPHWLRARGQTSFQNPEAAYPVVYIDEIRHGALEALNRIPSTEILRLEFFSTANATTRWGTGHPSGAINVTTGR